MFIPSTLVFADGEMTGLDERLHDMWELAVIVRGHRQPELDGEWLWQLHVPSDRMLTADPKALQIGRFHDRYVAHDCEVLLQARPDTAAAVLPALAQVPQDWSRLHLAAHLVWLLGNDDDPAVPRTCWLGIVPDFDVRFFRAFLESVARPTTPPGVRANMAAMKRALDAGISARDLRRATERRMPQHYQSIDVEAMAAGRLHLPPIWDSHQIADLLGVRVARDDMHTAMGDARFVERLYDAVMAYGRTPAILDVDQMQFSRGPAAILDVARGGWCTHPLPDPTAAVHVDTAYLPPSGPVVDLAQAVDDARFDDDTPQGGEAGRG